MRKIVFLLGLLLFSSALFASKDIDITAEEFEFDGMKDCIHAKGDVVVTQRGATITGERATYKKDGKTISLFEDVVMKRGKLFLSCNKAVADGINDTITAIGNVSYTMEDIEGSSGRAVYDMNKKIVTFTENPVAKQSGDFVRGETIIVDLVTKKVKTKGNAKVKLSVEKL
jgi:lipopolysaccharide transport protein LptA